MAIPGHVKAAFQELRSKAKEAQKLMMRQHRGPHFEAGQHVTEAHGPEETHQLTPDPDEACPDCESGVCETHGTFADDLQHMHDERHVGHSMNRPHGHQDQAEEEGEEHNSDHEDIAAAAHEMGGHDDDEPAGHGVGGMKLGGIGKTKKLRKF